MTPHLISEKAPVFREDAKTWFWHPSVEWASEWFDFTAEQWMWAKRLSKDRNFTHWLHSDSRPILSPAEMLAQQSGAVFPTFDKAIMSPKDAEKFRSEATEVLVAYRHPDGRVLFDRQRSDGPSDSEIVDAAFAVAVFSKTHEWPALASPEFFEFSELLDRLATAIQRPTRI